MITVANTIEDLLEILAGLKYQSKIAIDPSDATIMHSIARQSFKGTALTDRQYALMQEKLQKYKEQFTALEYDFDRAIQSLRQPLRHIDRSKYIKIVEHREMMGQEVYESYKQNWKWIEVRFPFAKKLIMKINAISSIKDYYHNKGSHKHFFKLNEKNTINVIEAFSENEFDVDKELLEFYYKIKKIQEAKLEYVPCVHNLQTYNLDPRVQKIIAEEIGELDKNSLIKFVDRKRRYGISEFDELSFLTGDLAQKIALRPDRDIHMKPSEHRIDQILEALESLDRYPILFVLSEKQADNQLHTIFNFYKNFLPAEQQSVLFRLDSDQNNEFNQMVKEYNLNNWVDKNTKIVYINNSKLPKVLMKTDWAPITTFTFDSRLNRNIDFYIKDFCDLIIWHDEEMSLFRRYSSYYGNM
jgi:hypothetical protein